MNVHVFCLTEINPPLPSNNGEQNRSAVFCRFHCKFALSTYWLLMLSRLSNHEHLCSKVFRLSMLFVCAFAGLTGRSQAGCHYGDSDDTRLSEEEASRLVVTEQGLIQRRGDVHVVYEYGKFKYYSHNELGPCEGPGCNQRENETSLTPVVNLERQRSSPAVCEESRIGTTGFSNRRISFPEQHTIAVTLDGIFRPPRVS